jgi:hypothetical protein
MERRSPARPGSQELAAPHIEISEGWIETGPEDFSGAFQDCEIGEFGAGDLVLAEAKRAQFIGRLKEWGRSNARIAIYFQTEGEIERFREIMEGAVDGVDFVEGTLARGFCFPAANLSSFRLRNCSDDSQCILGGFCGFDAPNVTAPDRFQRTREGDLVVHLEHGIGRFLSCKPFL